MIHQLQYRKIFRGTHAQIIEALNWLDTILEELELGPSIIFNLRLCFEELFTNIVKHGCVNNLNNSNLDQSNMGNNIIIGVNFSIAAEKLRLTLEDNSMPFDINAIPTSGINKPLKQLKPGGLGIHLIKNIADNLYYIPLNPGNKVVVEFNCTSST